MDLRTDYPGVRKIPVKWIFGAKETIRAYRSFDFCLAAKVAHVAAEERAKLADYINNKGYVGWTTGGPGHPDSYEIYKPIAWLSEHAVNKSFCQCNERTDRKLDEILGKLEAK